MRAALRRSLTIDTVSTHVPSPLTTPGTTPLGTPVHSVLHTPTSTPDTTPQCTPRATPYGSPAGTPRSATRSAARSVAESAVSAAARAAAGASVHTNIAEGDSMSPEDKRDMVLAEPKFGMFSMTKYFWRKPSNILYLPLPMLVFIGQWTMFFAVMTHNLRAKSMQCANEGSVEAKMLFISVCLVYFAQSVQILDNLRRRRAKKLKMTPEASYTVMLDKLHEHTLFLVVSVTNLVIVYTTESVLEAMFNCVAMSFLSDLENEWQTLYYAYRVEEAVDVYDRVFVTHRQNARRMLLRRK